MATDWAWHPGLSRWIQVSELPGMGPPAHAAIEAAITQEPEPVEEASVYHHVSMVKFIVYSICSLGLYELFWAYRNWKFIKARDNSGIMPFWRALFLPLWCYSLTKDVADTRGGAKPGVVSLVAGVYFFISILWKLPDPYWLITLSNFIPLLYPVKVIDELNRERGVRGPHYSRVKKRHVALSLVGVLVLANAVRTVAGLAPDTRVIAGQNLPKLHAAWLRKAGVVKPDETVEYFYCGAIFSTRSKGCVVTDKGVAAYEKSGGELEVQRAAYAEIANIHVTYSDSWFEDTQVFIEPRDKDGFYLLFSTEKKMDRLCVKRVMDLWNRSKRHAPEETVTF